jgi:hypothetical protein
MSEASSARMARLVTVIVAAVAWFFISNHCVLAELQTAPKAKASCHRPCCDSQSPAKSKTGTQPNVARRFVPRCLEVQKIMQVTTLRCLHCSFTLLDP